ncbi:hypothetical protein OG21DRAFT_135915 [Imleria badia]|nr:hypothetical protein OG21DRAFT_135915 [Imleria badia]
MTVLLWDRPRAKSCALRVLSNLFQVVSVRSIGLELTVCEVLSHFSCGRDRMIDQSASAPSPTSVPVHCTAPSTYIARATRSTGRRVTLNAFSGRLMNHVHVGHVQGPGDGPRSQVHTHHRQERSCSKVNNVTLIVQRVYPSMSTSEPAVHEAATAPTTSPYTLQTRAFR